MAAGVRLLGLRPRPAVTVRAVCRSAGMTERYFYEHFSDRDTFVRAVYDHVGFRAIEARSVVCGPRMRVSMPSPASWSMNRPWDESC